MDPFTTLILICVGSALFFKKFKINKERKRKMISINKMDPEYKLVTSTSAIKPNHLYITPENLAKWEDTPLIIH